MLKSLDRDSLKEFEFIYDEYSSLLYGIILKIALNKGEAEKILIKSFNLFFYQNSTQNKNKTIFTRLLEISIKITSERLHISKLEIAKIIFKDLHQNALQLTSSIAAI